MCERTKNETVLVTGATAGIGFHTAETLASMGAEVVTGHDERRGRGRPENDASRGDGEQHTSKEVSG